MSGGPAPASGPRPGGPEVKTQRPEKRYTPDELLAMMRSGQLGNQGPDPHARSPRSSGWSWRPAWRSSYGSCRTGRARRPGGPAGPGLRRPGMGMGPGIAPPAPAPAAPMGEEEDDRRGKAAGSRLGSPADRAGRRARRNERATERRVTSPLPASALLNADDDDGRRGRSGGRKHKGGRHAALAPARKIAAQIEPPISVRSLSEAIGVRANDLIKRMMTSLGQLVTINATLDDEAAQMLALEFGVELEVVHERTAEDELLESYESDETESEDLEPRPPVITILGHVDHGKTSLLDRIRKANVVQTESGGITQHIGAYTVDHAGHSITFVDTPGHEAFTAMRARGANVTDIVVLVVAADDGVMPQTREAIDHAKAAEVPIVVALNKIDLPNVDNSSNINKIYGELAQQGLNPEEWGGDTPVVRTSSVTGQGIDDLLATLDALAELNELKANPKRPARGTCLEASISEGRGVVATVLVQDGTLRVGDAMVCGDGFGRVRALFDDKGRSVAEAGPSTPVEVSGLDAVPTAGEKFGVVDDIAQAREIAETRRTRTRGAALGERTAVTLENLYSQMAAQKVKNLNLILKADVQGSLEALIKELDKLENAEVPIRILLKGVGGISESDILLADASQAIVIGFRVAPEDRAVSLAEEKKIEIRRYDIIYQVTDEIRKAIEGMLVPEIKEVHLGRAVVRQIFKISKIGTVAGCVVTQGTFERSAKARLIREGREIYKGAIEALKRFKDDVKEVREGYECGIKISNFDDLKLDDVIEAYRIEEIRRSL
ncbi:MAG: translation initiation factor IF-2 [Isosphaeraceae bacterium]